MLPFSYSYETTKPERRDSLAPSLPYFTRNKCIEKEIALIGKAIRSSSTFELLGITLDKNLNFKRHIESICNKANNKTKALF